MVDLAKFARASRDSLRRRWKPTTAAVAIVALLGAGGIWWAVSAGSARVDCATLQEEQFNDANTLAIACNAEVEVVSERTPWETSWAGPDGITRLEVSAVPTRTKVEDEWVPVDSKLIVSDGSIETAAAVFPIELNPGGSEGASAPLATIERDGHTIDIWFPLELPAPAIDGSRAIYDFGDGIRLAVTVNVDGTGITSVVELENAVAAQRFLELLEADRLTDGTAGTGLDIGYGTNVSEGLTLAVDEYSQTLVTDLEGETQFYAPPPIMWDSSGETVTYDSETTEVASTDRLAQPSAGDRSVQIDASLVDSTIVVTPDAQMLADPDTV